MPDGLMPCLPWRGRESGFYEDVDTLDGRSDAARLDEDGWALPRPLRDLAAERGADRVAAAVPAEGDAPAPLSFADRGVALDRLRRTVRRIEGGGTDTAGTAPLGLDRIDRTLAGGGLALGCLHDVAGPVADAAAAGFAAAAAAACHAATAGAKGGAPPPVLWITRGPLPYAPGLAAFGLTPDRLLIARAEDDAGFLWALEEAVRSGALSAVVGDAGRDVAFGPGVGRRPRDAAVDLTASRRLQLACEAGGTAAILLRRHGPADTAFPGAGEGDAAGSVAVTRWRVASRPSAPTVLPGGVWEPGVGLPTWRLDLVRNRGGLTAGWDVVWQGPVDREAAKGGLRLATAPSAAGGVSTRVPDRTVVARVA